MPLRPLLPALLLALVMSIVVGVLAVGRNSGFTLGLAVALFALQMLFALVRTNAPFWKSDTGAQPYATVALSVRRNTLLAALVYAWGAAAILALYSLSGLNWRHWWQYGAAMALVAGAVFLYAHLLTDEQGSYRTPKALNALMWLTIAQGLAVIGVLVYLIDSGKLGTPRSDWAANYVFAAGSLTLAALSVISVATYRRLKSRAVLE
jgi:NAD(P)-dependent dehydrogenase (short-subunit alcohol dehydrogenase family)